MTPAYTGTNLQASDRATLPVTNTQAPSTPHPTTPSSKIFHTPGLGQETQHVHLPGPLCSPDLIPPKSFPTSRANPPSHLLFCSNLLCSHRHRTNKRSPHAQIHGKNTNNMEDYTSISIPNPPVLQKFARENYLNEHQDMQLKRTIFFIGFY